VTAIRLYRSKEPLCVTGDRAEVAPVEALPASLEWKGEVLPLEPVDELSVLTVCDNVTDILLPDQGPAKRLPLAAMARLAPPLAAPTILGGKAADVPLAQHGFSALVQVRKGGRVRRLLFDTGITPGGCAGNLRRLGQDPAGIEAIVCSHGHFDHTTGLSGLIGQLGQASMPVLIHPEFWARRRLAIPGEPFELPATSRRALEDAGFDVIEQRQPSFLYDRSVLITGEVDRVTGFEKGFPVHQAWRGRSREPDPLILDDQALIAHVAGRGLVVLTGCGHAGVINICRYAQRLTGVDKLHAVIGGFHLAGPLFEPVITDTVSALEQLAPEVIVPAHCTGWKATHAIAPACPAPSSRTASAPPSTSPLPRPHEEDRYGRPRRAGLADRNRLRPHHVPGFPSSLGCHAAFAI
jgi:7,8-dihydropterin-6-yl-methyl-4-(beta-D-ribofuranosyl)aminobenzene 5'-phosphate synthase